MMTIISYSLVILLLLGLPITYNKITAPPPTNVVLTTGEIDEIRSYIVVKWTPSSNVTIVTYTIMYGRTNGRTPNKTITIDAPATSTRLNDLKPFANFTVFVRVNTKDGAGQWSEPKTIRTPTGVPYITCNLTRLYSPSSSSIFIAWEPLLDYEYTNGVVIRWLVFVMDGKSTTAWFVQKWIPLNTLQCTVDGLKPYHLYEVLVLPETKRQFYLRRTMRTTPIRTMEGVPSRAPANLSSNLSCQQYTITIEWSPLQTQYINGKLLGYHVLINQDITHYKNLTVTNNKLITSLNECKNYSVQVAAMTTPGAGKYARTDVITTCPCGSPVSLYQRRTVVAKEGQHVTLPCEYKGRPEPTVNWIRISKRQRFLVTDMLRNGTVVQIKDDGLYACVLNNTFGTTQTFVRLIVAKDVVVVHFQVVVTNTEFTAELTDKTSQTSRQLELNVTNAVLRKFHQSSMDNVKTIHLKKFSPGSVKAALVLYVAVDDTIKTTLISKQVKELLVKTFYRSTTTVYGGMKIGNLTFQDPPGPPLEVQTISRKSTSVQVSWSPPEYNYLYGITSYSIKHRKTASKDWIKGKTIHATTLNGVVEDLEPSTGYEMIVVAYNKYGEGKSSVINVETKAEMTTIIVLSAVIPICLVILMVGIWILRKQKQQRETMEEELAMTKREKEALERKQAGMFNLDLLLEDNAGTMVDKKWKEIPRESIEILGDLGSGAFGEVKKAKLHENGGIICAVKMLKAQSTSEEIRNLVNELNIMVNVGEHPNIVSLIGASSDDVAMGMWIIIKYATNGCLYNYLQSITSSDGNVGLLYLDKLKLAYGIANGMAFLEMQKCIHRDLAARNVLLGNNNQPMVSDFGLSRDVYECGFYENTRGGKLPVRWMAIESLIDYVFTTQSDVWSFGVVAWEIESLAKVPYAGFTVEEIIRQLREGYRLEKPHQCDQFIYDLMLECWRDDPKMRPKFRHIVEKLETALKHEGCESVSYGNDIGVASYEQVVIDEESL